MNRILTSLTVVLTISLIFLSITHSSDVEKTLEGLAILMCIASKDFKDIEFEYPRNYFEERGAFITVVSNISGECTGMDGMKVTSDLSFDEVDIDKYDVVVVVGGKGVLDHLTGNKDLQFLLCKTVCKGKVLGAICMAPMVLAEAGVLDGVMSTVYDYAKARNILKDEGAKYTGEPVVVDGKIITANSHESVEDFTKAIEEVLTK